MEGFKTKYHCMMNSSWIIIDAGSLMGGKKNGEKSSFKHISDESPVM